MKHFISIPLLLSVGAICLASANPSHACMPYVEDNRFHRNEAPAGGAFFVHLESSPGGTTEELEEQLLLVDSEENEYEIEIISQAGGALAIRVPNLEVGTQLEVKGLALSLPQDFSSSDSSLKVVEGTDDESDLILPDQADVTTVITEVESSAIPLTPIGYFDSCGGVYGPAIRVHDRVAYAEIHFPKEAFEQGPLVLDMWATDVGEELDMTDEPIFAGFTLGKGDQVSEYDYFIAQETGETVFFVLTTGMIGENADVHLRLRDPRTGLPGEVITKTIHLPERQENVSYGCQALPQVPMSFMGLFSLLLGMGLYRRRD